ncbi:hypothetical protein [Azospirillum argentinense]|uniref:Uncharacterized protein n=2 Tax=Azospirillum argentinense TaxID=2970906 RepID=A0A5B0KUP6_9PROT|nr:hypothetical protein [Azospirillum argentinense]KAA1055686.1 hypothetical protein FH063_005457 [Azospirillum argentinense]MBK3801796.1 hypothetical protein [Azospirillum argentinense]
MPYSVIAYSPDALLGALADGSYQGDGSPGAVADTRKRVESKQHYRFLTKYFTALESRAPRTIVIEKQYVDHDFLEDYAAYYSRCFQSFERFCRRIHFFSADFCQDDLRGALENGASPLFDALKRSYLGFIVVRPLPNRIIGRTCLSTYPDTDSATREFPALRSYEVSLFGIALKVRSVAFQEQDREVAACATSALWSMFQKTGVLFHHGIPSPVEITRAATASDEDGSRSLPNDGLTPRQQANAIRSIGLEPFLIGMPESGIARKWDYLRAVTHAYSGLGLPILISLELQAVENPAAAPGEGHAPRTPRSLGFHAVTAVGHRLEAVEAGAVKDDGPRLTATRLSRIFVHDDQAGPFARLWFHNNHIQTALPPRDNGDVVVAEPRHVIVPLYHKIRIPFDNVYRAVSDFDSAYNSFVLFLQSRDVRCAGTPLEWTIRLESVQGLKERFLAEMPDAVSSVRAAMSRLLTRNMPKYLWCCRASNGGLPMAELLYDATGLVQGSFFYDAFARHKLMEGFSAAAESPQAPENIRRSPDCLAVLRAIRQHKV